MINTITIELSAEDRARQDSLIDKLDELIKTLEAMRGAGAPVKATKAATPTSTPPEAETPAPVDCGAQDEAEQIGMDFSEDEAAPPVITSADVQELVVELVAAGKKAETRAIIKEYAEGVSLIPGIRLPEVMARLLEVKGA